MRRFKFFTLPIKIFGCASATPLALNHQVGLRTHFQKKNISLHEYDCSLYLVVTISHSGVDLLTRFFSVDFSSKF